MLRGILLLLLIVTFGCRQDDDQDAQENEPREGANNQTDESDASEIKCTNDDFCVEDAGQLIEKTDQFGEDAGQASYIEGDINDGGWDPCGDIEEISVAWDEQTDLEISPEEIFGPIVGTCTAPLTWDGESWNMSDDIVFLNPPSGQSEMKVTVEVDEQSIRYFRPVGEDAEMDGCTSSLVVDAFVSVQTEDGSLDDSGNTTIVYTPRGNIQPLRLSRDLTELGGAFAVELAEHYTGGSIGYRLDGAGPSCSGEIIMSVNRGIETPSGANLGEGSSGPLGAWTATGCPLGTVPLEVDPDAIEAMLDNVSFSGVWDDGKKAELILSIEVEGETSCADKGEFINAEVPARVTYGTSAGRIKEHTVETTLGVNYFKNNELRGLACHVSDEMKCDAPDDVIDYTLKDCSELDFVTIQFGIHRSESETYFSDEGIEIYENYRGGTAWPGSGDEVRYFNLEQPF